MPCTPLGSNCQMRQAATTGPRVRITEDVPILRVDHISIKTDCLECGQFLTAVSVTPILDK
jgi:hypothetical protein